MGGLSSIGNHSINTLFEMKMPIGIVWGRAQENVKLRRSESAMPEGGRAPRWGSTASVGVGECEACNVSFKGTNHAIRKANKAHQQTKKHKVLPSCSSQVPCLFGQPLSCKRF